MDKEGLDTRTSDPDSVEQIILERGGEEEESTIEDLLDSGTEEEEEEQTNELLKLDELTESPEKAEPRSPSPSRRTLEPSYKFSCDLCSFKSHHKGNLMRHKELKHEELGARVVDPELESLFQQLESLRTPTP